MSEVTKIVGEVSLQDIIIERKAERKLKAQQKRQLDLERISRNMKSASGMDPLEQFPNKMWKKMLKALDPEDRDYASRTHPFFSRLMEANKVRDILFPQVVQLDAFHRCFVSGNFGIGSTYELSNVLRRVSKTLRKSYDRWIEASFEKRIREPVSFFTSYDNWVDLSYSRSSGRLELSRCWDAFGDSRNPAKRFFPKALSISVTEGCSCADVTDEDDFEYVLDTRNIFANSIEPSLAMIADQIWHFHFYLSEKECSFEETHALLEGFISLFPNLRWLEFSVGCGVEDKTNQELKKASNLNYLRDHPFPQVSSLERLSFHYDLNYAHHYPGEMLLGAVIAANPQIKILDVSEADDEWIKGLPFEQIRSLPHLTSITLAHENITGNFPGLSWNLIEPTLKCEWPLQSIYMNVNIEGISMSSFLTLLGKFPTLKDVKSVKLKDPIIGCSGDAFEYLRLPNLTNLEFFIVKPVIDYDYGSYIHFFFSLQFLLHCGKLKTLSWTLQELDNPTKLRKHLKKHEKPGKTIDFRAGLRILYESNIWEVFPSLESCEVSVRKGEYKTEKFHIEYRGSCTQEYKRLTPDQRRISIPLFLSKHGCCRSDLSIQNCVALVK